MVGVCKRCGSSFNPIYARKYCSLECRFWHQVDKTSSCWIWRGRTTACGYGIFTIGSTYGTTHRVSYEWHIGRIPVGLTVHHKCFVRTCVNPDHLTLLTAADNAALQLKTFRTHCRNGHEFTEENTRWVRGGTRVCRQCDNAKSKRYKARRAAERVSA